MFKNIKIVCFDADDTLWQNEPLFRAAETGFYALLAPFGTPREMAKALLATEIKNLPLYGYGIKAFALSMIETALKVSRGRLSPDVPAAIIKLCRDMLGAPVVLLDGTERTLKKLSAKYKIVLATKGDLLDQERKLLKSGLAKYFHHIEIMSEKTPRSYARLLKQLGVKPREFVMAGNSLKSDILPVLEIGAAAIHIPHPDTWEHERVSPKQLKNKKFAAAQKITDVAALL